MRNLTTAVVKLERVSMEKVQKAVSSSSSENNMNATNVVQPIDDKLSLATARMSINDKNDGPTDDSPTMDDSIIMIPPKVTHVVTVSDDEMDVQVEEVAAAIEMPPPSKPRKVRTKKVKTEPISNDTESNSTTRSTRSKKPKEKSIPRPLAAVKTESVDPPPITMEMQEQMEDEPTKPAEVPIKKSVANVTAESVYEDARDAPPKVTSPVLQQVS